jgi:hypothetical protein
MIARIWHGMVPISKAAEYLKVMRTIAFPEYRATRGNRGAWCLHPPEEDVTHFEMLTFWDDSEAIKHRRRRLQSRRVLRFRLRLPLRDGGPRPPLRCVPAASPIRLGAPYFTNTLPIPV